MITADELHEHMEFNVIEGRFYWRKSGRGRKPDRKVGAFDVHGYGQINYKKKVYKEHHLVWLWAFGEMPKSQIDHINHKRRDNVLCNLREANNVENHKNRPMQRNNKSGYVGVSLNKKLKRWESYITVNGVQKKLGYFKQIDDAVKARKEAEKEYGFHENHGVGYGKSKFPHLAAKQAEKMKADRAKLKAIKKD